MISKIRRKLGALFAVDRIAMGPQRTSATSPQTTPAFPIHLPTEQLRATFNGSSALFHAARSLSPDSGHRLLAPAYMCGSEIGPFLHLGYQVSLYNLNNDLQVDLEDLQAQLSADKFSALLVTHYFGTAQRDIVRIAELAREHEVPLIEDCAHALFASYRNKPLGSFGDYAIFSPRKILPISEGGLLVSNHQVLKTNREEDTRPPLIPAIDRRLNMRIGACQTGNPGTVAGVLQRCCIIGLSPIAIAVKLMRIVGQRLFPTWISPELDGEDAIPAYNLTMSTNAWQIVSTSNGSEISHRRRANFTTMLKAVAKIKHLHPLIDTLDDECCPLYFPLVVPDPEHFVSELAQHRITAYKWWQNEHKNIDLDRYPQVKRWKSTVVALPVHQSLSPNDVQRIIERIHHYAASIE